VAQCPALARAGNAGPTSARRCFGHDEPTVSSGNEYAFSNVIQGGIMCVKNRQSTLPVSFRKVEE